MPSQAPCRGLQIPTLGVPQAPQTLHVPLPHMSASPRGLLFPWNGTISCQTQKPNGPLFLMVTRVCAFASCPPLVLLLSSSFHPHCLCPGPGHCLIPTQGQLSGQISWSPTLARVIFLKDPHASKSDMNTLLRPSRSFLPYLQHSTSPSWPERSYSSLLAFAPCRGGVGGPAFSPTSVFGILLFLQGPTKTISADSYIQGTYTFPRINHPCLSPQSSDSRTFQLKSWALGSAQSVDSRRGGCCLL